MFTFLNPFLLWGAAAVAVPILIHLLLRQRPKPRPWAAMRWLLAAAVQAQRKYKLTNLLLLLLRCAAIALLALALARPSLGGLGEGGRLVLVIDTTMSMGPTGAGDGALGDLRSAIDELELPSADIAVVTVADRVTLRSEGDGSALATELAAIQVSDLPGGIDRAASEGLADDLLAVATGDSDVILISDFRSDEGTAVLALLEGRVRSVSRWRVGRDLPNALIAGLEMPDDLTPGTPSTLQLALDGSAERAEITIDGGLPVPGELLVADGRARLVLPPLEAGEHLITVDLLDEGLLADDVVRFPLQVRASVPALVISENLDRLSAVLAADSRRFELERAHPSETALPLPTGGLTVLRGTSAEGERLRRWVDAGGVLWTDRESLARVPAFAPVLERLVGDERRPGGTLRSGQADLDPNFERATVEDVPALATPLEGEVLLWAGADPLVVAAPVGDGWLILEAVRPAAAGRLADLGAFPLWVRRTAASFTARGIAPTQWQAGSLAPRSVTLQRGGEERRVAEGEALLVAPGLWTVAGTGEQVIVLPSRNEGRLQQRVGDEVATELAAVVPESRGAEWSLPLLLALVLLVIGEGALAAWAGRRYGR